MCFVLKTVLICTICTILGIQIAQVVHTAGRGGKLAMVSFLHYKKVLMCVSVFKVVHFIQFRHEYFHKMC